MSRYHLALQELRALIGFERNTTSHTEKWISGLGGFLGIVGVCLIASTVMEPGPGTVLIVASMAASAVLLFAVPQGALSQPWSVLGGHFISAFMGVTCQLWFPDQLWTGALAVSLAIVSMHYLRCIHPPGGATALAAVIGGPEIHALGYGYLLTPILLNVSVILVIAVAYNACFSWRRYPAHLTRRKVTTPIQPQIPRFELTQEDLAAAMETLDSYVDITSENLATLLEIAQQHAEKTPQHPPTLQSHHHYSNGRLGQSWGIRQIIEINEATQQVHYQVIAGQGASNAGFCSQRDFQQWARFEVTLQNGRWIKTTEGT